MTAGRNVNSQSVHWCTPRKYVDAVSAVFGGKVALDPCSNRWSIVGAERCYQLPEEDGLVKSWDYPTIYVNPPYGADKQRRTTIRNWLYRCVQAHEDHGSEILALVPVATNTRHWKDFVWGKATMACFLYDTRLRFLVEGKNSGKGAPMSCAMICWSTQPTVFEDVFQAFGAVVDLRSMQVGTSAGESSNQRVIEGLEVRAAIG